MRSDQREVTGHPPRLFATSLISQSDLGIRDYSLPVVQVGELKLREGPYPA